MHRLAVAVCLLLMVTMSGTNKAQEKEAPSVLVMAKEWLPLTTPEDMLTNTKAYAVTLLHVPGCRNTQRRQWASLEQAPPCRLQSPGQSASVVHDSL